MRALTEKECIELGVNPQHCGTNFEEYHQEHWNNLQVGYDLRMVKRKLGNKLEKIHTLPDVISA